MMLLFNLLPRGYTLFQVLLSKIGIISFFLHSTHGDNCTGSFSGAVLSELCYSYIMQSDKDYYRKEPGIKQCSLFLIAV